MCQGYYNISSMKVIDVLTRCEYNDLSKSIFHLIIKQDILFDDVDELEGNEYKWDGKNLLVVTSDTIYLVNEETNESTVIFCK